EGTRQEAECGFAKTVSTAGSASAAPGPGVPRPGHCGGCASMSQQDTAHAWWSRLRHQELLLSPVVMLDEHRPFRHQPQPAPFHKTARLRDAYTRFVSTAEARQDEAEMEQSAILAWTDALLENYVGHVHTRF